jgi:5-methyltetrahydrofolate--homocysteine methyltransferase
VPAVVLKETNQMTERDLAQAIAQLKEDEVKVRIQQQLDAGIPASKILAECNRGMIELGNRFADGSCFIPELMYGGLIMKHVTEQLSGHLQAGQPTASAATVVMGTVQHDIHDIGKDIVVMMLRGVGFEVIDLGVDVPPEKFVEAIKEHQPLVAGMSLLLTTCFDAVSATVEAIKQASLRDRVSLMVGGAAASELLREKTGCDFYGKTAVDGVEFAGKLAGME